MDEGWGQWPVGVEVEDVPWTMDDLKNDRMMGGIGLSKCWRWTSGARASGRWEREMDYIEGIYIKDPGRCNSGSMGRESCT
jgi:hypothetical protein